MTKANLEDLVVELEFQPNNSQLEAKSAFWAIAADSPLVDPANITLATVQQIYPDTRVRRWWGIPGFQDWFCNRHEWRQKVEYLVNIGLDAVKAVLEDPDAAPSARIKAFEVIAKLADREPAKVKEVRFADSNIEKMSKEQLEAYIRGKVARLGEVNTGDEEK